MNGILVKSPSSYLHPAILRGTLILIHVYAKVTELLELPDKHFKAALVKNASVNNYDRT